MPTIIPTPPGTDSAPVDLSDAQRRDIATRKATCPFIGAGIAAGALPVRNTIQKPLASIDDVVAMGNSGEGSDLGELLKLFAEGNHAFMPGIAGRMDAPVPAEMFSLDFPGSQGSHPGHSGILQGDPKTLDSGRFSATDFARLLKFAEDGHIRRSDIAKFIADNVARDPAAHAPGLKTASLLARDFGALTAQVARTLKNKVTGDSNPTEDRKVFEKLTKLLGEDNLIGSAGEFGLLAAFLANAPNTKQVDAGPMGHEPAFSVADLTAMFSDKKFPEGWRTWRKTITDWVTNTTALAFAAEKETVLQKLRD